MKNEEHLDLTHLRELEERGDKGFIKELYDIFIVDAPEKIENMKKHLQENNLVKLGRESHGLKGICGTMGTIKISALAKEIDSKVRANINDANYQELISEIEKEYLIVKELLYKEITS